MQIDQILQSPQARVRKHLGSYPASINERTTPLKTCLLNDEGIEPSNHLTLASFDIV